jgi:hypothetical protein
MPMSASGSSCQAEAWPWARSCTSISGDLERFAAQRMGAATYEVASSHVPMLSHPDVVLDAIRNLVKSLQGSLATA